VTWEVVIGLETHAQLTTVSKIFSGASTAFGAPPNTQASAVDLALPGTLPVLNRGAVERAIRFGLAVGGKIAPVSVFERKNYFYPDLPKGYQVSQYVQPVVSGGSIAIVVDGAEKTVRLTRAHLEEDAGKLLHEQFHGMSGVDLNRAGTPLLEIVSEPDMRSAAEAVAYAKALHSLVRWIGICDGNMQEGSFRCDANVSVRRAGEALGTRCEIKNLNSFRFLERAIEFEVRRQVEVIGEGGKIKQETRLFDPDRGETRPMRSKEDAHDYRYFPDPDLLPLEITAQWIEEVKRSLGKLPAQVRREYEAQGVNAGIAAVLTESPANSQFVAATTSATRAPLPLVANWIAGELMSLANEKSVELSALPVTPQRFGKLLDRIVDGTVSGKAAKQVLFVIAQDGGEPDDVIERLGLRQISDSGALEAAVEKVIAANAKLVDDYRAGKEKAFNALVGQVMKATQGKANPAQVNEILRRRLAAAAR
jgi:aspartyl-tRNA(Asn)/glutamyl-tRNA(Gln) amidotransferase subunit B